jgi:hypothetical protein
VDTVDAELDRLISKRASQDRRPDPDEREELWKASVARHNARRAEEMRAGSVTTAGVFAIRLVCSHHLPQRVSRCKHD